MEDTIYILNLQIGVYQRDIHISCFKSYILVFLGKEHINKISNRNKKLNYKLHKKFLPLKAFNLGILYRSQYLYQKFLLLSNFDTSYLLSSNVEVNSMKYNSNHQKMVHLKGINTYYSLNYKLNLLYTFNQVCIYLFQGHRCCLRGNLYKLEHLNQKLESIRGILNNLFSFLKHMEFIKDI